MPYAAGHGALPPHDDAPPRGGLAERRRIAARGQRRPAPRLPEQPVFYPARCQEDATPIARRSNAAEGEMSIALLAETGLPFNRKERYFTGTVLPMIVCADDFGHFGRLTELAGLGRIDAARP